MKIIRGVNSIRLLLWFVSSILYVSQVFAVIPIERDSLYHEISSDTCAEFSCRFVYEQGNRLVSACFGDNADEFSRLGSFIRQALANPEYSISRIRLTGYCSIEDRYTRNEVLARERTEHFHIYLRTRYPELCRYPHDLTWVAEDWDGLVKLAKESHPNEYEEILKIIRKTPVYDDRESLLLALNGGRAYREMGRTVFPLLRRVELQIEYGLLPRAETDTASDVPLIDDVSEEETIEPLDSVGSTLENPRLIPPSGFEVAATRFDRIRPVKFLFALKTNLSQWAGILPDFRHTTPVANVALEVYISDRYSIELGAMYSYWRFHSNREFQGLSGYRLEPRYRFSFPRGRFGAYVGIYGRVGDYDLRKKQADEDLPSDNRTGDYWDAGLSAGFTVDLIGNFGLEVGGRAGYVSTKAIKYIRDGEYNRFESRSKYNKPRLTDLNVSLRYNF